jgi:hypothetical protein
MLSGRLILAAVHSCTQQFDRFSTSFGNFSHGMSKDVKKVTQYLNQTNVECSKVLKHRKKNTCGMNVAFAPSNLG